MRTGRLRRWLADSTRLVHLSVLLFLPLIVYVVIEIGQMSQLSYFVFPPLASATFTIFFDPESAYSAPARLVGGLTLGAIVGSACYALFGFTAVGAAVAVLGASVVTWTLGVEHPSAISTGLLALVLQADSALYAVAVFGSTVLVAAVFVLWRDRVYEERARYLYDAVRDEDRVCVPVEGNLPEIAGRIAGAHRDGRVVLVGLGATRSAVEEASERIGERHDVRTETVVADPGSDMAETMLDTAERYDCSVILAPWTRREVVDRLFGSRFDVVAFHTAGTDWEDVFVPVRGGGKLSRLMVELASRLARRGDVSVGTVIGSERERRRAEKELFTLVSAFEDELAEREDTLDTRIIDAGKRDVGEVIVDAAEQYDLTVIGGSTDRPLPDRLADAPTAHGVVDRIDGAVAVVHSGEAAASLLERLRRTGSSRT